MSARKKVNKKPYLKPKTENQASYLSSINAFPITFCIGPAGVGKSYIACYAAADKLIREEIEQVIVCRPAVESGENLGFLPGTIDEKFDPYLQPLYSALSRLAGKEVVGKFLKEGKIQAAPLAYMRGVTFENCLVILDEAQNVTKTQMKMFLTRKGDNSKFLINGDITQIDLSYRLDSGLIDAHERLQDIEGVNWIEMTKDDIVRDPVVRRILEAYEDETISSNG